MAFPDTPVLDDCQRANETPLSQGGEWATPLFSSDVTAKLASKKIVKNGTGTFSAYRVTSQGADCEVYAAVVTPTVVPDAAYFWLYARIDTSKNGYAARFEWPTGYNRVYRIDHGVFTEIGIANTGGGFSNGGQIGVQIVGDRIELFINGGSCGFVNDSTYASGGRIGLAGPNDSSMGYSSFGGGSAGLHGPVGGTKRLKVGSSARDQKASGVSVGARSYGKAGASARAEFLGGTRFVRRTYFKAGASARDFAIKGVPQFQPAPDAFADPYIVLLVHANGADASTVFTDASSHGNAVTAVGAAQVDTVAPAIAFGQSALLDGSGSYISIPDSADFNFGSGDFTIDFWVRFGTVVNAHDVICKRTGDGFAPFVIYQSGANVSLYLSGSGTGWDLVSGLLVGIVTTGTWYHVAVVRSGGVVTSYLNGSAVQSASIGAASLYANNLPLHLGGDGPTTWFNGWLDEVRISKGVARWTSNFTPPTVPYTGIITLDVSYDDVLMFGVG